MVLSRKRRKPQFAFGQTVSFGFMDSTRLPQFADSFDHFFQGFRIFLTLTTITLHIPIRGRGANLAVIMAFDLGVKPQPGRQRARKQRPRYSRRNGPQMWLKLNLPEKAPKSAKRGSPRPDRPRDARAYSARLTAPS
jgi:hypothetical protein